jgi:transposase, IS6 family
MRPPNRSWRVDETYIRVAGRWTYLYRAIDSAGNPNRVSSVAQTDLIAAKGFLQLALSTGKIRPRVINVDGHPACASAIRELKDSGDLSRRCQCRPSPYLNNIIEHRAHEQDRPTWQPTAEYYRERGGKLRPGLDFECDR